MRWSPGGSSDDIEDRRGEGGGGFRPGGIHVGLGGMIVLLILSVIFKRDFFSLLSTGSGGSTTTISQPDPARDQREKPLVDFVTFVLNDTQSTWTQILAKENVDYRHAKLCCSATRLIQLAVWQNPRLGPFIVPRMRRSILTSAFMMS